MGLGGFACWVPVWFDLDGCYWMEVLLPRPAAGGAPAERPCDPLGRVLGVMPCGLDELLMPVRRGDGSWERRSLEAMSSLRGELSLALLWGALATYRERCRAVATPYQP